MCFITARKAQYLFSVFNDKLYVYLAQKYKKGFVNRAFIQMFKQYNISYKGQRFQKSTKFDYSVSIIE